MPIGQSIDNSIIRDNNKKTISKAIIKRVGVKGVDMELTERRFFDILVVIRLKSFFQKGGEY